MSGPTLNNMKKYRIIVVENDEDEQLFIREAFHAADMFDIIQQVENGDKLMEWLGNNKTNLPDFILSDLNMPGMNGYDIIEEMKTNPLYAHIPIIITSTSSTPSMMQKAVDKGAAAYLVKPDTFVDYEPFAKELHGIITEKKILAAE
jgi:CheY-like chemotaxis protein